MKYNNNNKDKNEENLNNIPKIFYALQNPGLINNVLRNCMGHRIHNWWVSDISTLHRISLGWRLLFHRCCLDLLYMLQVWIFLSI